MKFSFVFALIMLTGMLQAQPVKEQLITAMSRMEKDEQFKHASISFYVVDSKTGAVVFEKDAQRGLAPASTQKVVTSVSAFELLGKDFRYQTGIGYDGAISDQKLNGNLVITGSGDPTLGSWRWATTSEKIINSNILGALAQKNIREITGGVIASVQRWETQATPRGWTWEDMGNYYGAGAGAINWHENQYNLVLAPGKLAGDDVKIIRTEPNLNDLVSMRNELKTGAAGSGDNAVIYLPEYGTIGFVCGTVPAGKETFIIKGAIPIPHLMMQKSIQAMIAANGISIGNSATTQFYNDTEKAPVEIVKLLQLESPTLDSINYWFLRESVNLYGEAFVKTISLKQKGFAATDSGLAVIRYFWSSRGIFKAALNIIDGSGLSPANRITTHALVTVMQYARDKKWYPSFFHALPLMNGIKMKSGYISGVRSYTGYVKNSKGNEYTFAFIINNFNGSPADVREKMWKLLDILK